ncbi:MAG: hypothetical protein ACKOQ4_07740 [Mycobacterium sp.]
MSWSKHGGALALIVFAAAVLASRRRVEVWHTLSGRDTDTGP